MTPPSHAQKLENELEAYFRSKVRSALGGMAVKFMPVTRGVPDRIVILPLGRIRFVELKTHKGRLSAIQEHWHSLARGLGCKVDVVYGKDGIDLWVRQVATEQDPKPRKRRRTRAELEHDRALQAEAEIAAAVQDLEVAG